MEPIRTTVTFFEEDSATRTFTLSHTIPNVAVDQQIMFDHPSLSQCVSGKVTGISHVLFLAGDPMTYIDVKIGE